jgi:hypothetical protein
MKLKMAFIALTAIFMAACGNQNKTNSGSTRINRYSQNQLTTGTTTCSTSTWYKIYNENVDQTTYKQTVADFSFHSMDDLGDMSGAYSSPTGVSLQMTLGFSNGQLTSAKNAWTIADSYTINDNGGYYNFVLPRAAGSGTAGVSFNVQLGDDKGYVHLVGQKTTSNGQQVWAGTVTYYNTGASYSSEQLLGYFVVPTCAVVGL